MDREIPQLSRTGKDVALVVDGRPFVMLAGEMHNSAASDARTLDAAMDRAVELGMNSVIAPVSWELVEPEEGAWDFASVDVLLAAARQRDLRLGLLWFGAWKNAACYYAPEWVKRDLDRFRRAELEPGQHKAYLDFHGMTLPYAALSALCEETRDADARAFARLMAHLRGVDAIERTVLFVQVENECGLLGAAREHSLEADEDFGRNVPARLLDYLRERAGELQGRLGDAWRAGAGRGGWEGVFGDFAEETFTAWHMARYIESVAAAGKAEYPLPLVVNCWLDKGREAGAFPTGGPVARVMEVWRCAAPSIDVVAPDIYVPDFCGTCDGYRGLGNPLVIEETAVHGRVASRAVWAVCHHHAPCFAPFGFEDMGEPFDDAAGVLFGASLDPAAVVPQDAKEYARVMAALGELVARARDVRGGLEGMDAVISERPETDVLAVGSDGIAGINVSYDDHPGACAVVPLGPDEALVLALHCRVTPVSLDPGCPHADILSLDELVSDEGGAWSCGRRLNGDEATLLRFDGPTLLRLRLFSYR